MWRNDRVPAYHYNVPLLLRDEVLLALENNGRVSSGLVKRPDIAIGNSFLTNFSELATGDTSA